ncbi:MAG: histidine phosphatase family protein [Clostridia bacterium]|nr:histidine phosphatase family protein [Clostridia bacterium]
MVEKIIYLIRHAEPDYPNGEVMCLGQKSDLPLSPHGYAQAKGLGEIFRSIDVEAVYSSPLLRARQTAEQIAGLLRPLHMLNELIELDGGEWDGLTLCEIQKRYPQYFEHKQEFSCPPGGESDQQGLARILPALSYVEQRTKRSAVMVAHGGINRLLLCSLLGEPTCKKKKLVQEFGAINVLRWSDGCWQVEKIGVSDL